MIVDRPEGCIYELGSDIRLNNLDIRSIADI